MALKVTYAKSGNLTVGKNTGMQGSNYNPQKTAVSPQKAAGASVVQPAAGTKYVQPAGSGSNVQAAATAAQIQAAVAAAQAQAVAAAARAKEVLRANVQGQVDSKASANVAAFKLKVGSPGFQGKISVGKATPKYKLVVPESTEYEKEYAKYYKEAMDDYESRRKPGQLDWWGKITDSFGGQEARDIGARSYAEQQAKKLSETAFKDYEKKINKYNSKLATMQAAVNAAATTMTQPQYDAYVAKQQAIIDKEYKALVSLGASYDARTTAYGKASSSPLSTGIGKLITNVANFASDENPIWKYTLGGGDKTTPSLVTAPSRALNTVGNFFDPKGTKNYHGGVTKKGIRSESAWDASFGQRNINWQQPKKASEKDFEAQFKKVDLSQWKDDLKSGKVKLEKVKALYRKEYYSQVDSDKWANYGVEFFADPLFAGKAVTGAAKVATGTKFATALKGTKPVTFTKNAASKLKSAVTESTVFKKLTAEHQSPADKFFETRQAAQNLSRAQQEVFVGKIQKISEKLKVNPKYDLSIFDDLKRLTPGEREVLQRMTGDGKFAVRDRILRAGRGMKPWRDKMEQVAQRYIAFADEMRKADKVTNSAYGRGKKMYSPRTVWADDLEDYNFRLRRGKGIQSGDDFLHGVTDRFFKSNLDEVMAHKGAKYQKYSDELKGVSKEYERTFHDARATVQAAEKRYKRDTTGITGWARNKKNVRSEVSLGRSVFNTAKNIQAAPTKIWKKSVLKYRPAWTVNNVLYNTQAGMLAAGVRAPVEQLKMLNPRYYRKAMEESRGTFGGNIGKEIGGRYRGRNPAKRIDDRLTKFYSGVEDWSRVAAGRAAMKKGLTKEQAVKRVNKYLFDYKTSNWERPIKAVVPFWSFQKNLTKAATTMPFDRPIAAKTYNSVDRYQQEQYDTEFETLRPKLKEQGYNDTEIDAMKEENAKYYKGRLKVGDRWMTTPFNAFSDRGLSKFGINPYLSAAKEVSSATDQYGRTISGDEAGVFRRVMSKFPQADLGYGFWKKGEIDSGRMKPSQKYIGKAGHDGFGLGKEKQGYDPTKKNYVKSMDPRTKLTGDALAFVGVPKTLTFDKQDFLKKKQLQKLTADYFKLDTKGLEFSEAEAKRTALFKKHGVTAEEFYSGVLSKYDTENTTRIKGLKADAAVANKALFEEYGRQPQGTRNLWVTKKLRELNAQGYFNENPYLKSFKYVSPTSVAKADKQLVMQEALRTGDWSKYRSTYGVTKSAKALARDKAVATGDWTEYAAKYGTTRKVTPHQYAGKYFKTADSMAKYKEGEFWRKYMDSDKAGRLKLMAENPQYNKRGDWTIEQWLADKRTRKAELKKNAIGFGDISKFVAENRAATLPKAARFQLSVKKRQKKVVFKAS